MWSRMFGRSRRPSSVPREDHEREDGGYVLVGDGSSPSPDAVSTYTLEGATAFMDGSRRPSTAARTASVEDPVEGVPFHLTVRVSAEGGIDHLSEAMAVVARMESTDWDAYEYDFKLEHSVLDECSSKMQNAMLGLLNGH